MVIIAIMGGDGTGKTTLARALYKLLKDIGIKVEYRKYFEEYFILSIMLKIFKRYRRNLREKFLEYNCIKKPSFFKLWPYIVFLDQLLCYIYMKLFKQSEFIILDRYTYDFAVTWKYYGVSSKILEKLYLTFPKPEIPIVLKVSPYIAMKRKSHEAFHKKHDIHFFKFHIEEHLKVAKMLNIPVISTENSLKTTLDKVMTYLRKYLINNLTFEDRIILFFSNPNFSFEENKLECLSLANSMDKIDWSYVIDLAVKNGVEYIFLENITMYYSSKLSFSMLSYFKEMLHICQKQYKKLLHTLSLISEIFDKNNIDYVIIKTISNFKYVPTDIDILLNKRDYKVACRILRSIYDKYKKEVMHDSVIFIKDGLFPVDLHTKISWFSKRDIDEKRVLKRKLFITFENIKIPIPSPEDELMIVCAHSIFQHHYTTLNELYQIINLLEHVNLRDFYKFLERDLPKDKDKVLSMLLLLTTLYDIFFRTKFSTKIRELYPFSIYYFPKLTIPIFHPLRWVRVRNSIQVIDFILTILRRIRFKVNKQLPYNINWLSSYVSKEISNY